MLKQANFPTAQSIREKKPMKFQITEEFTTVNEEDWPQMALRAINNAHSVGGDNANIGPFVGLIEYHNGSVYEESKESFNKNSQTCYAYKKFAESLAALGYQVKESPDGLCKFNVKFK